MSDTTLHRVAKFEVKPTPEQEQAIQELSNRLRLLWNLALEAREEAYREHLAPIYKQINEARDAGDAERVKALKKTLKEAKKLPKIKQNSSAFAQMKHLLTPLRRAEPYFKAVPQAYQQDCLKTLDASFKSYYRLKKKGDPDARKPRKKPEGWFQEISIGDHRMIHMGEGMASICLPGGKITSRETMTFPIPPYQQDQLKSGPVRKATLFRCSRGRLWISAAFAIPAPETMPVKASPRGGNIAFVALGSTAIAVVAPPVKAGGPWREEVTFVPRADRYWKEQIEAVERRMKLLYRKGAEKQSKQYRKLKKSRKEKFRRLGRQQKQQQREMAQWLLGLGDSLHFVVNQLVVRSKDGKLADGSNAERRKSGMNWSAQNTGWISNMLAWMRIKAAERGSRVETFRLEPPHPRDPNFRERKLATARLLRDRYFDAQ